MMLLDIDYLRSVLCALRADKKEWTTPIPTDEQFELVATILPLPTTCRIISESMSSDKKITMDRALTAIVHLMDRCASLKVKEIRKNSVTGVGPFMVELIVELEKRSPRGGCDIMSYAVGCLLHPFLKDQQLHAYGVRDEIFDTLKTSHPITADWMSNQQGTINVSDEITHELHEDDGETEFLKVATKTVSSQFRQSNATTEGPPITVEWARFRETTVIDSKVNVLNWWRTHRREMPILAGLARKYYCLPASSASSERAFSEAGQVVHEKRCRLSPKTTEKLVFINENFDLLNSFVPVWGYCSVEDDTASLKMKSPILL
ncbi:uncharacterized protein LOC136075277 [Hydra vulgaris]|uniref:Uncharacterized protein LOC136075277 n=1 Tax=Hydra vulgaris TaxID=6087 RepID=A0ABM4B527_HYDVU